MSVYFDYAATHPTEKEIIEKSFLYTGNPSSPHGCGIDARKALENVRGALAKALGYGNDIKKLLSEPQYSTMEELDRINRNKNRKRGRNEISQ